MNRKRILKKLNILLIAAIMILTTAISSNLGKSEEPEYDMLFKFSFPEPTIETIIETINSTDTDYHNVTVIDINNTDYHNVTVTMGDLPIDDDIGVPQLPVKIVYILLPEGHIMESINVTCEGNVSLGDGFNVAPGTELGATGNESIIKFDPTIPYPTEVFTYTDTYSSHGYSIMILVLHPIYYIAETGEIYYYENMIVDVQTVPEGSVSPFFRGVQEDQMMIEGNKQILDDYAIIDTYVSIPDLPSYSSIVDPSESYKYVIITDNTLKDAFQNFMNYKINSGTPATTVTVQDIESCPAYWWDGVFGDGYLQFNDTQCHIRNFIKDAYANWETNYILLGGDVELVPLRCLFEIIQGYAPVPSDVYYSCLDGSFDSNLNEIYGEPNDGEDGGDVDLYSEVYVGRACVDNADEVSTFTDKTIAYLEETDNDYLEKVLMIGEHLHDLKLFGITYYRIWGGAYMNQLIGWSLASGYFTVGIPKMKYSIDKLYDRHWRQNNWPYPYRGDGGWPSSTLISRINDNVHIINHAGHSWINYTMKMYIEDVDLLTNEKPCFIYSWGCWPGALDYDCIAEYFTVKTAHGAFAGIWNTRSGYFDATFVPIANAPSAHFCREFWDAIYREGLWSSELKELGPANQDSKEDNLWRLDSTSKGRLMRHVFYTLMLFGDPQIAIKKPTGWNNYPASTPNQPSSYISGQPYTKYTFSTSTWDINGDQVFYKWNWGDGSHTCWLGPYDSNETATADHSWNADGIYEVSVKARDIYGEESRLSTPLSILLE